MESCAGCGIRTRTAHPWACVMAGPDAQTLGAEPVTEPGRKGFVAVTVCDACHRDPDHRTVTLKGHFFPREAAATAVALAGGPDLAL